MLETAGVKILIYGPEFIEQVGSIMDKLTCLENYIFVGEEQVPEQKTLWT